MELPRLGWTEVVEAGADLAGFWDAHVGIDRKCPMPVTAGLAVVAGGVKGAGEAVMGSGLLVPGAGLAGEGESVLVLGAGLPGQVGPPVAELAVDRPGRVLCGIAYPLAARRPRAGATVGAGQVRG